MEKDSMGLSADAFDHWIRLVISRRICQAQKTGTPGNAVKHSKTDEYWDILGSLIEDQLGSF